MISEIEIAWLAGLLEGEGNFGLNWNSTHTGRSPRVRLRMTDEDIVERVAVLIYRATGKQYRVRCYHRDDTRQPAYEICCYGDAARIIMRLIVKHLGQRRKQKIWQTLNDYEPAKSESLLSLIEGVLI